MVFTFIIPFFSHRGTGIWRQQGGKLKKKKEEKRKSKKELKDLLNRELHNLQVKQVPVYFSAVLTNIFLFKSEIFKNLAFLSLRCQFVI